MSFAVLSGAFWSVLLVTAGVSQFRRWRRGPQPLRPGVPYDPALARLDDPYRTRQPFGLGSGGGFG